MAAASAARIGERVSTIAASRRPTRGRRGNMTTTGNARKENMMDAELEKIAKQHEKLEADIKKGEGVLRDKRKQLRGLDLAMRNGIMGLPLFPEKE